MLSYLKEATLAMNCCYLSKQEFNEFLTKHSEVFVLKNNKRKIHPVTLLPSHLGLFLST